MKLATRQQLWGAKFMEFAPGSCWGPNGIAHEKAMKLATRKKLLGAKSMKLATRRQLWVAKFMKLAPIQAAFMGGPNPWNCQLENSCCEGGQIHEINPYEAVVGGKIYDIGH